MSYGKEIIYRTTSGIAFLSAFSIYLSPDNFPPPTISGLEYMENAVKNNSFLVFLQKYKYQGG